MVVDENSSNTATMSSGTVAGRSEDGREEDLSESATMSSGTVAGDCGSEGSVSEGDNESEME